MKKYAIVWLFCGALSALYFGGGAAGATSYSRVDASFEARLWARGKAPQRAALRTIHVAVESKNASDANAGTLAAPLQTLAEALRRVKPGPRVLLHPGFYRETVAMRKKHSGTASAPVVIEAAKAGTAILTGSDVWTNWQAEGDGVYSHAWLYKWGFGPDAFADAGVPIKPLGRRAEMIFAGGQRLRQVLRREELAVSTFFIDEEKGRVFLRLPPRAAIASTRIEVAVRPYALDMDTIWGDLAQPHDWPSYYVLRGLVAQHYTGQGEFGRAAVMACGANFLIEDCRFSDNNATALTLRGTDIVVRRTICNNNGSSGISTPPNPFPSIQNVLFEDVRADGNNWRGAMGDFHGYAVAGMKLMTSGSVVLRRFSARDNASPGVWLDKENRNFLLEKCRFIGNKNGPGLWIEISGGPFLLRDSVCAFNSEGVMISNSSQITLLRNTIYGNANAQIGEWSPALDRESFYDLALTMRDNVIASTRSEQALWRRPDYPNIIQTLRSGRNLWHAPADESWFIGDEALDFSGWIARTRQDTTSVWAPPHLRNPERGDFRPRADSPLARRAAWGTRAAVLILPRHSLITPDTKITMTTEDGLPIRYTLDGSAPTIASPLYTSPIPVKARLTVKARAFGGATRDNPIATAYFRGIAPPAPDVFLSDLTPLKNVVGWGEKARNDRSIADAKLRIDGIAFARGLGAHAPSELLYAIPEDARRFVCVVGIDDNVVGKAAGKSSVTFAIYADETRLAQTAVMREGELRALDVQIPAGSHLLRLVVTDGGDGANWDQADWAQAGFLRTP